MHREATIIKEISIENGDARPIGADLRTCAAERALPLVIACHGFLGYKRWSFFPELSNRIAAAGFHVLTMSFSMTGIDDDSGIVARPEEFARNTVSREVEDLENVCRFVREGRPPVAVDETVGWGLFGYSRGAAVAMIVASRFPEIRSMVTWATPSRLDRYSTRRKEQWRRDGALIFTDPRAPSPLRLPYSYYEDVAASWGELDLPRLASALTMPHLMVHCRQDAAVTLGETMELLGSEHGDRMRLEIIDGCGHSFGVGHPMRCSSAELERAIELTENWFTRTLRVAERSRSHAH